MPRRVLGKMLLAQAESEPYRRNTRIPLGLPITIRGKDKVGGAFEERTQTIDVSKNGIKTSTIHSLLADAKIRISNGHPNEALPARVVWQGHTNRPDDRTEIGVEFEGSFETGKIWTIDSLPDDWVDGPIPLTASQKLEYFWARNTTLQKLPELQSMPGVAGPPSVDMSPNIPLVDPDIRTVGTPESAINWEEVQADEVKLSPPTEADAPIVEPTAWDEWFPAQAPQGSLDSIEKGPRAPSISKEAPVNLVSAPPDSPATVLNQLAQILCEQAETITKGVDGAVSAVRSAADESVKKLQLARQQIEVQLGTANLGHQKRLAEINAESSDALRKKSEALLADFQKQLERQVEAQLVAVTDEHTKRLAAITAGSAEEVRQNSEALLADFRKQLQHQVEAQIQTVIGEHQKQLAGLVVSSAQQIKDVVASFKDISARQLTELKEKNQELQHQNEEYMRTCRGKVREEIAAAKSAVAPRPLIWILAIVIMATIALTFFAYFSTQSVMRLRADPPAEFVDPNSNPDHQDVEEQLARAYWNSTVRDVQRTYKFRTILPEQPPPEFQIQPQDTIDVRSKINLDASRDRYWQRLRKVWDNPQVWEESFEWNPDWIVSPLKSLGQTLRR